MLKQRIITALILAAILLAVLTIGAPWAFAWFALLTVGIVIGEWLALLGWRRIAATTTAVLVIGVLFFVHADARDGIVTTVSWWIASIAWGALALGLFATGRFPATAPWRAFHAALAILLPAACWLGLVAAYADGGFTYLVSLLAIVWAADVAAYFAGRAFGRRKLAPAISPGKTWAGAIGGAIAGVVVAAVSMATPGLAHSYFAVLATHWPVAGVLVVAIVLVALSIVGDLFESQLKRQHGVKDSGRLLPGHGGVFDRVDAMLPIVPIALLLQRFG